MIARDLTETVAEFEPGARVIAVATTAQGAAAIEGEPEIAVAFPWLGPGPAHRIARDLARRRARVVLLGPEADEARDAWLGEHLPVPFSIAALIALLRRIAAP